MCHEKTAVAAPTPASDGERIYALYSSNDVACFDLEGNLLCCVGSHLTTRTRAQPGHGFVPGRRRDTVIAQIEKRQRIVRGRA